MSFRQTESRVRRALFITVSLLAASTLSPQRARADSEIVTDRPPPAPQAEHAPPKRDGYVWGAGHWEWNGRSYVWASGTWIIERRSAHWAAARWEQVAERWRYIAGHWER